MELPSASELWHHPIWLRVDMEITREPIEQWPMHGRVFAPAHLVPIVSGHLQFRGDRHLYLRHRQEVVEASLARDFLGQKPQHVLAGRGPGEPWKEWVALARASVLKLLEPLDELADLFRDVSYYRAQLPPHRLDIFAFGPGNPGVVVDLLAPRLLRKARFQLHAVIFGELGLKAFEGGTVKRRRICRPGEILGGH